MRRKFLAAVGCVPFVRWGTRKPKDDKSDFATARRRVCDDMASDEGLRIAYQSNIAMAIYDNSALNHESCNRLADEIMHVVFEV